MYKYRSLQSVQLQREYVFLANFIITKYLKQEVDDDLTVCVDELSPCSLSLIVTWSEGNDVINPNGEVPY